jgi:hypothetical protein
MSKRCELQKEYYQQYGNYKGNGKYKDEYVSWLEEQILALRIHSVMQAEGSATLTTFEGHVKKILLEMESKFQEYEDNINDKVVNPNGDNTHYFRGKADAYRYSAKQIRECLRWHSKWPT